MNPTVLAGRDGGDSCPQSSQHPASQGRAGVCAPTSVREHLPAPPGAHREPGLSLEVAEGTRSQGAMLWCRGVSPKKAFSHSNGCRAQAGQAGGCQSHTIHPRIHPPSWQGNPSIWHGGGFEGQSRRTELTGDASSATPPPFVSPCPPGRRGPGDGFGWHQGLLSPRQAPGPGTKQDKGLRQIPALLIPG